MLELCCVGKKGVGMSIQVPSPLMACRWTALGAWDTLLWRALQAATCNAAPLRNKKVLSNIRDALISLHDSTYLNTVDTEKDENLKKNFI